MNKKSAYLFYMVTGLVVLLMGELFFLYTTQSLTKKEQSQKKQLVQLIGLPDLALVTETSSIRHRSLTDLFSLYREDAALREYFPSTFTYTVSP